MVEALTNAKRAVDDTLAKIKKDRADAAAAKSVSNQINALPKPSKVKTSDKSAIKSARKAYNALTADQKKWVSANALKKLEDDEKALKALQTKQEDSYDNLSKDEKKDADAVTKALGVDKDTAAQMLKEAKTLNVSLDTVKLSGSTLAKMDVDSKDAKGSNFRKLTARSTKRTEKSLTLQWKKVKGASGYLIYGNKCGKGNKLKLIKTISGTKTLKWTHNKLKKGTYYKYLVVAYKTVNKKKMPIAASAIVHAITHAGKTTAIKAVKVNKTKVSLKKGKTFQIKASATKENKKKKIAHHRKICYESANKKVATVDKNGKVKGVKKGTTTIYVYVQNGLYKTVNVTVK